MAALLGRTEVGVKEFGREVDVFESSKARLMYYLDCICTVLDMSDTPNLSRLRKYRQHSTLTEEETDTLIALCFLLSPDELNGKVIFQDDAMCGNNTNTFFEISAVQHNLLVSDSIIIGGQRRAVSKIMAFTSHWLAYTYIGPMQEYAPRLARIALGQPTAPSQAARNRPPRSAPAGARQTGATDRNSRPQTSRAPQPARGTSTTNTTTSNSGDSSSRCILL